MLLQVALVVRDVATSAPMSRHQPPFISALLLTAFLSTYCCIFLLSFFFPANDKLVSFCIFLYNNYLFLNEKQTEKWTKKR